MDYLIRNFSKTKITGIDRAWTVTDSDSPNFSPAENHHQPASTTIYLDNSKLPPLTSTTTSSSSAISQRFDSELVMDRSTSLPATSCSTTIIESTPIVAPKSVSFKQQTENNFQ